jgi:anthranilate/para-aminobenzoate synthase component I
MHLQVGGAVTYDSDPEAEYAETLAKGRALLGALGAEPEEW